MMYTVANPQRGLILNVNFHLSPMKYFPSIKLVLIPLQAYILGKIYINEVEENHKENSHIFPLH